MVAPFPSLTNVGYAAILRTAPGLGYEDKYYDPALNRVGGGVFDRLRGDRYKRVAPYHALFDWEPPALWGVGIYYFPMTSSRRELRRVEEILHDDATPIGDALQAVAGALPAGWQYPAHCIPHLRFRDLDIRPPGFEGTPWSLRRTSEGGGSGDCASRVRDRASRAAARVWKLRRKQVPFRSA